MSFDHLKAYLKAHFANHDTDALVKHLEDEIDAKIDALRQKLKAPQNYPGGITHFPGQPDFSPGGVNIVDSPDCVHLVGANMTATEILEQHAATNKDAE